MPRMDLKQNYRDEGGVLYRAGKDREIPQALYDALSGEALGNSGEETKEARPMPYADLLAGAGLEGFEAVRDASDEQILAIDGIGPARLAEIRAFK